MFHIIFYEPVYNLLVLFLQIVPLHDIGASIVLVTVTVKTILLPINLKATRTQHLMKAVEDEIKVIRDNHKDKPQELSRKLVEVYKREKINPLSSLIAMLIQIPVFIALYFVFSKGMKFDGSSIYSFVSFPEILHTQAFGILDVTKKNIFIAISTGITAYILARRQTSSMVANKKENKEENFQDHFMKSMRVQMLYVLPVIIGVSSYVLPAALGLYWTTNNILSFLQDVYIKDRIKKEKK